MYYLFMMTLNDYIYKYLFHILQFVTCFVCLLLPLIVVALPAADKSAKDKSDNSVSPVYAVAANEVFSDITPEDITRSKRSGSGGFDIFSALKNVSQ